MTTPAPLVPRLCDICGIQDTDPRHVTSVIEGGVPSREFIAALPDGSSAVAIAELLDPSTIVRHVGCCANNGCTANCAEIVTASNNAKGAALRTHIQEH